MRNKIKEATAAALILIAELPDCEAQSMSGVYDFGLGRSGEKRGDWTPNEWLAATLITMTICMGLVFSVGLCYYVKKRQLRVTSSFVSRQSTWDSRRRQQLTTSISMEPNNLLAAHI